ncbi:MAG: class I SAM-dependent methyltransferase [Deltaproteobacteria bacterium]|nr:class I SAM-dependent methyltransferase [Deltaproteobacteria bacterium]
MLPVLAGKLQARLDLHIERIRGEQAKAMAWCERTERPLDEILGRLGATPCPLPDEIRTRSMAAMLQVPVRMGGGAHADLLHALARGRRWALETGVAYGWSTTALLAGLETDGHVVSIDLPYPDERAEQWVGAVVPDDLRNRWTLLRGADRALLPAVLGGVTRFDIVHYDSDKSTRGRRWAFPLIWEHLTPGALLVSDDISDNLAFSAFARRVGREPLVVRAGRRRFAGILVR